MAGRASTAFTSSSTNTRPGGAERQHYQSLGSFKDIFHYLTNDMAAQFCPAATNRVLLMPLMTQAFSGDCGTFAQRWPEIAGCILGRLALGLDQNAPFQWVTGVIVSSFSSGITTPTISAARQSGAPLGGRDRLRQRDLLL
jgi:hypothetical protein